MPIGKLVTVHGMGDHATVISRYRPRGRAPVAIQMAANTPDLRIIPQDAAPNASASGAVARESKPHLRGCESCDRGISPWGAICRCSATGRLVRALHDYSGLARLRFRRWMALRRSLWCSHRREGARDANLAPFLSMVTTQSQRMKRRPCAATPWSWLRDSCARMRSLLAPTLSPAFPPKRGASPRPCGSCAAMDGSDVFHLAAPETPAARCTQLILNHPRELATSSGGRHDARRWLRLGRLALRVLAERENRGYAENYAVCPPGIAPGTIATVIPIASRRSAR